MRATIGAGLVAGLSIAGSLVFACAAPLAAIVAFAAVRANLRSGLALVGMAWITNQIIGFAVLGYPLSAETFAWGLALGAAAALALVCVRASVKATSQFFLVQALAFATAFIAYELALYGFGILASASSDAFSAATVGRVLAINLTAFAALILAERALIAVASPDLTKAVPEAG